MTLLYIFPHPDDESFGPAPVIARQVREGHAVHLLTLTRGGATKVRHELGLTVEEMGEVRVKEMECVARVLGLTSMQILDLPDGGMKYLDPREVEGVVGEHIAIVQPDIVVTYAVTGISGHPDHLVCHNVVKRVFCEQRHSGGPARRLALFTLVEGEMGSAPPHLRGVPAADIGARITFSEADLQRGHDALQCYETYKDVVAKHQPLEQVADGVAFELFGERGREIVADLTEGL